MLVAVNTEDGRKLLGHPGRAERFSVYEVVEGSEPELRREVTLTEQETWRTHHDLAAFPLGQVDAILTASAGRGFARRMEAAGIDVLITDEADVMTALRALRDGQLEPGGRPGERCGLRGRRKRDG